jgi:prepilin-type N-terminal cleavage/methylation domain-containing protein/prepilin-type processing-associated H-X9-DG protein
MNFNSFRSKKSGFTLIELLVVIAIIAILAAILFPVFAKVREKARQTQCLSNEKQMGLAVLQYVQDFEETYPMGQITNTVTLAGLYDWTVEIAPYIKAGTINGGFTTVNGIQVCPSFPQEPQSGLTEQGQYHAMNNIFADYDDGASRPTTQNDVDHPAEQIMVFEGGLCGPRGNKGPTANPAFDGQGLSTENYTPCWAGWNDCGAISAVALADASDCDNFTNATWATIAPWAPVTGEMCGDFPRYRHNGYCNVLWCDGHAKAVRKGSINYQKNIWIPSLAQFPWSAPA